jgi:hypothetical protein
MEKFKTHTFYQSIFKCYTTWMETEHKPKVNKPDKLRKDMQSLSYRSLLSKVHMCEINNLPTQKKYILTVCMILINN